MTKEETEKMKNHDIGENKKNNDGTDSSSNIDDNNKKVEVSLEEEILDLKDKIARAYAEMENQRRRYDKEKEEAFEYGGFAFAKEALNLLDNLERSKLTLVNDEELKNTDALKKIINHLDIINKDMISIFKKNHIDVIDSINKKLDPNLHQAMMEIEDDNKAPGTVVKEIQKGFMMKDRLLRPSLVAVSKKKERNDEKNEKNKEKKEEN